MIPGYSEDWFGTRLAEVVSPARPIQSIEHLQGREAELESISRALYAPGRHAFVYGDRGVGKSSLAATAAFVYQSTDATPIFVSGSTDDTFRSIVANVVTSALGRDRTRLEKLKRSAEFSWRGIKLGGEQETSPLDVASQIQTIGDAAELLKHISKMHSQKPIVVLDEFDTIKDISERNKFAGLLKLLGDQSVNVKFIFTGVGKSLDELLGAHPSAYRQLDTTELPKLGWEARRRIVEAAANAFDLSVNSDVNWRIASVCDGYPYYVHLITEKMLWEAFADADKIECLDWPQYHRGLRVALDSINAELRRPYEMAVTHRAIEFEDVMWSTADDEDLFRSLGDMYQSYQIIADKRGHFQILERTRYTEHVRKLKGPAYGAVLESVPKRQGWYAYREKMLRGYVRMQAEAAGVQLTGERATPKQKMAIPSNSRTGFRGPSVPHGVRLDTPIEDLDEGQ